MKTLEHLCSIHAPSGEEFRVKEFLLSYIKKNKHLWKVEPEIFHGNEFLDCLVLVFGRPKTVVFAHMDSVGFTVRYNNEAIPIGGPHFLEQTKVRGYKKDYEFTTSLSHSGENQKIFCKKKEIIEPGTTLTYIPGFIKDKEFITSPFLDDRLGIWICLKLAETLENGIIAFTAWEEHGGGSVDYLAHFIYHQYKVHQALIADITWVTEGIFHGKGVVVSLRDKYIPRKIFIDKVRQILDTGKMTYQVEVEEQGSSDGGYLQHTSLPFDWCFVGAAEEFNHSPIEKVHLDDIESMLKAYQLLLAKL